MRLSLHTELHMISRRAKFCSVLSQFFKHLSSFLKLSLTCHGIVRIVSSPFSSPYSIQFTTLSSAQFYLASFLALGRGALSRSSPLIRLLYYSCSVSFSFMLCFRLSLSSTFSKILLLRVFLRLSETNFTRFERLFPFYLSA